MVDDPSGNRFTKCATSEEERARLACEVRVLRALAHPGVVRLIDVAGGDPPDALVLERVTGGSLGRMLGAPTREVVQFGAELATTIADIHDVGWTHGAIRPEHVLVDAQRRPVICGCRSAAPAAPEDRRRLQDIGDLTRLIRELLPPDIDRRLRRILAEPTRRRRANARLIARRLLAWTDSPRPHRRRRLVSYRYGAAASLGVASIAIAGGVFAGDHRRPPACPVIDAGCRASEWVPPRPYHLSVAGPKVIVLGRWECTGDVFPAVLALDAGSVWAFRGWPRPERPEAASLVGQVPGARSLIVLPSPSGCDRIGVITTGRTVVLDPR